MRIRIRWQIFIGVTLLFFLLFGIPFYKMGFDCDFFGVLQDARLAPSWHHYWQNHVGGSSAPYNEMDLSTSFGSLFRPLWQHMHLLEWYLFGRWFYGYTLMAALFYAASAGILAVIFSYFYTAYQSIILGLLWATHPSLTPSLLSQTVLISTACFITFLSAFCYILYFLQNKKIYYILSLVFYFWATLSYDLYIIAPIPLFLFLFLFYRPRLYEIIPFFATTGLCLFLRFILLGPLKSSAPEALSTLFKNSLNFVQTRTIPNIIQGLRPFWGLQESTTLIALILTLLFSAWIVWYFFKISKDRLFILWLLLSFSASSWGIFIGNPSTRYFALGIPFFVLLLHHLAHITFSKKVAEYFLLFVLFMGGARAFHNLSIRQEITDARDAAMHEVVAEYPSDQYLFFIVPYSCKNQNFLISSGLQQGLQLFSKNDDLRVYHVIDYLFFTTELPSQGTILSEPIPGGYRFKVTENETAWFEVPPDVSRVEGSMGEVFINNRMKPWQSDDISVLLKPEFLKKEWLEKTLMFAWDPHTWKFVLLDTEHLMQSSR
ncbi:hypothetical protein JKY79_02870 [Candidatus Babeliales bacterium]|nr:hypothetical protein [Candidatus Babeliales bacterium]